jgi:hypothetical protein
MKKTLSTLFTLAALTLSSALFSSAHAITFTIPNSFTTGSPIKAAEMNANFLSLQTELQRLGIITDFGATLTGSGTAGWTVENTSSALVIYGLQGKVTQAGKYSSGVRGEDATAGTLSYGVEGNSTSGTGVYGSSSSGAGLSGYSSSGSGVKASSFSGTALEIDGAIKVTGTVRPAFVHTATSSSSHITCIDNPITNNDPNALVTFVHRWEGTYYTKPFGIYYTSGKWCIFSEDITQAILTGTKFNVIVFKQ